MFPWPEFELGTRLGDLADELGLKAEAEILLLDPRRGIVIPTADEWVGLNLLDRDGEV